MRIYLQTLILLLLSIDGIAQIDGYYQSMGYGSRTIVLVAFDANYSFTSFMTNLRQFAAALTCPYRHQFVTFYFGHRSTQIDCDYRMSLVECVEQRFIGNRTTAMHAFEASLYQNVTDNLLSNDDRNFTAVISELLSSLDNEYQQNIFANDVYLPGTYMFTKNFILLTNFVIANISKFVNVNDYSADNFILLAINLNDALYSRRLFSYDIKKEGVWFARVYFDEKGIDRIYSIAGVVQQHAWRNVICLQRLNGPISIGAPFASTSLFILMAIATTPFTHDRNAIITNFIRQITNRFTSEYCAASEGLDNETRRNISADYLKLYITMPLSIDPSSLYNFRMPWMGERVVTAIAAQSFVDSIITDGMSTRPAPSKNLTTQLPHSPQCDDTVTSVIGEFGDTSATQHRFIVVTNVVYECFALKSVVDGLTMSEYLAQTPTTSFDYVYFNDDTFNKNFSADDLHRSLAHAFVASNRSQSHLYFVPSLDQLNTAFDAIAFCADRLKSTSLVNAEICVSKDNNDDGDYEIFIFSSVSILALVICLSAAITLIVCLKKQLKSNKLRREFVRQIKINECHQFDFIAKLWQVSEENVEIEYSYPIGRGAQSFIYSGKLKQKSPIVSIFTESNLAHFDNCAIAIKKARSHATDYFYEQTLNEIRICSKIGYHRNVCAMLGYIATDRLNCLLLELAETDLTSVLRRMRVEQMAKVRTDEELPPNTTNNRTDCIRYFNNVAMQIVDGMLFIAAKKLIHRDLAARNVLLASDNRAMITDFGLCIECDDGRDEHVQQLSCPLPVKWLSIESINENRFSEKTDVWSFGILLYEMYSFGDDPYAAIPIKQLKSFLNSGQRMDKPNYVDDKIYEIMLQCWKAKPDDRPPFNKMKKLFTEVLSGD